jgi:uncharacterized membrane protein YqjE
MEPQEKSKLFKFLRVDAIIEHLSGLIEARLELAKLELREELAKMGASIIATIVLSFLGVLIIIFLSISLSTLLNDLLESKFLGYFIVTGFYTLILILLLIFNVRSWLQEKIENMLINTEEEDQTDE